MPKTFQQVSLSLRSDQWARSGAFLVSAFLLLAGWTSWAVMARITQLEISDSARLEVRSNPAPIQATFDGRITAIHMTLGESVRAGDILVEADTRAEQLSLAKQAAELEALTPRIAAVQAQISAEQAGTGEDSSVLQVSSQNAQAQVLEAEAQWQLADKERQRDEQLKADGIVSDAEEQRARANAESKRAALDALKHSLTRLRPEYKLREGTRQAHIDELIGQRANLQGQLAAAAAERNRLQYEMERKIVRAPVSGRLAECLPLTPGAQLRAGDKIGVILPSDDLHIVAEFAPAGAFGKLRPGQPAALRLDGFPWTQYGVVPARVSQVATEIRDGRVRVELSVLGGLKYGVRLQHGLPGSVEVETERISPLALLLRTAGDLVGKP